VAAANLSQINPNLSNNGNKIPQFHNPQLSSSSQNASYASNYRSGCATISFSLLNTMEFSAKADNGVLVKDVLRTIRKFDVKLDEKKTRLVFKLPDHDRLLVRFSCRMN
jgi:hypothetical protein